MLAVGGSLAYWRAVPPEIWRVLKMGKSKPLWLTLTAAVDFKYCSRPREPWRAFALVLPVPVCNFKGTSHEMGRHFSRPVRHGRLDRLLATLLRTHLRAAGVSTGARLSAGAGLSAAARVSTGAGDAAAAGHPTGLSPGRLPAKSLLHVLLRSSGQNRRGLSRFCGVLGAKWDCPPLRKVVSAGSNAQPGRTAPAQRTSAAEKPCEAPRAGARILAVAGFFESAAHWQRLVHA